MSEQEQLLEIYKLHAELADRVSQRREGANRIYVSLLVGLVIFLAALLRFGMGDAPVKLVLCTVGAFGVLLSASWFVVVKSYQQLNTEKFRVLHDLETMLVYRFFTLEWDPCKRRSNNVPGRQLDSLIRVSLCSDYVRLSAQRFCPLV